MNQYASGIHQIDEKTCIGPESIRRIPVPATTVFAFPIAPSLDQMTVEQTAAWIHEISYSKQWNEAQLYAKSCIENQITGRRLIEMNIYSLATFLKIRKLGHRLDIMEAINADMARLLSAGSSAGCEMQATRDAACRSEMGDSTYTVELNHNSSSLNNTGYSDGYCSPKLVTSDRLDTSQEDLERISQSCKSLSLKGRNKNNNQQTPFNPRSLVCPPYNQSHTWKPIFNKRRSHKSLHSSFPSRSSNESIFETRDDAKLVVTYEGSEEINHVLYNHFQQFGYDVQVEPMENNPFGYVINFESAEVAKDAFKNKQRFGYKLEKYKSGSNGKEQGVVVTKHNEPKLYKILNRTTVRKGIEKTSEIIRDLYKGELVAVDKLVENRARIVEMKNKGFYEEFGWASLRTDCGIQLLVQFMF